MTIYFLHTAQSHIDTFQPLLEAVDKQIKYEHIVVESLLAKARQRENLPAVQQKIKSIITEILTNEEDVLLCTCSTIGPLAEQIDQSRILRVDRPMMEEAVQIGGKIKILATLESTIASTMALFNEVAAGYDVDVEMVVIPSAWSCFEAGDLAGYFKVIAREIESYAEEANVIILAQASMVGALDLIDVTCPVLSSPQLGVQAIVELAKGLIE